jgi:rod shape-determining protein MreB
LLEAPLCAALGVGFDFSVPTAQMLLHISASRTEAAVIFLGDMLVRKTAHVGGLHFDEAIVRYVQEKYQLAISPRTAEQIKIRLVMMADGAEVKTQDVRGRDMKTRELRVITLSSDKMKDALKEALIPVVDAALSMVEGTADEIRVDIAKGGVVLTGGGVLQGMDQFLADVMGVRATVATNADTAAAEGAAKALVKLR